MREQADLKGCRTVPFTPRHGLTEPNRDKRISPYIEFVLPRPVQHGLRRCIRSGRNAGLAEQRTKTVPGCSK